MIKGIIVVRVFARMSGFLDFIVNYIELGMVIKAREMEKHCFVCIKLMILVGSNIFIFKELLMLVKR